MYIIRQIPFYIVVLLLQMFFFNNIHLFNHAVPLVYVMLIINIPKNIERWQVMLTAFVIGLMADSTVNTPGISAASLTMVAFLQNPMLKLFTQRANAEVRPSLHEMGNIEYPLFVGMLLLIFFTVYFLLTDFTFSHWQAMILDIIGSSFITWILVLAYAVIRDK